MGQSVVGPSKRAGVESRTLTSMLDLTYHGAGRWMGRTALFELLMAGFFAVACLRAHGPIARLSRFTVDEFFRLPDRLERLRRTRWQWASMVAVLLVVRLQQPIPLGLEIMIGVQFVVFMALPLRAEAQRGVKR